MKKVLGIYGAARPHWVGDGFPVRTLFSYLSHNKQLSPFLLLDYAGPVDFPPATRPRGVAPHPHRGFETVTIVYHGEVAHRDSTGDGGVIGPGDVQWMTAASGILHEEFHSPAFTESGGPLEMVQLWVNLPSAHKMAKPSYQAIVAADIPVAPLPEESGSLRVIAGNHLGHLGPARTFTPMNVWDIRLHPNGFAELAVPDGWNAALAVLHGAIQVNADTDAREGQLVVLDRSGEALTIKAQTEVTVLLLSGEPIDEPVVGHGPFVMNTQAEINQAIQDYSSGRFGNITHRMIADRNP